ncbi:MAG: tetratricopeptide repeat protein [Magnetococcales bacterium]|nr:tetratricopeptide repeat protein [Magnetococcales bacterium]
MIRSESLRPVLLVAGLLIVWIMLPYGQVVTFPFINLDDTRYLLLNPAVQNGLTWESVLWAWTNIHVGYWIPLTWTSLLLDITLFGLHPGAIHGVNLLLHVGNTLLLFFLFRRLTGRLLPSALAAALFGIHPQHVEAVVWVVERKEMLAGFFGLLSLHGHVTAVQSAQPGRRIRWSAWLCYGASLLCKPNWVALPLLLLLLDFWPLQRSHLGWRFLIREKLPFFILAASVASLTLITTASMPELHGDRLDWELLPLGPRLANMVVVYPQYVYKTILPWNLAAFYPHPQTTLPPLTVALSLLFLLLVSGVVLARRHSRPSWFVGWFWFLLALFPVTGLAQAGIQAMADRFTYMPHMGLFLVLAAVLPDWQLSSRHRPMPGFILAAVILVVFSIGCWRQVGYWQESGTLWRHALQVTASNPLVHYLLGKHELDQGRPAAAVEQFSAALHLAPRSPYTIHYKMARSLLALHRFSEARTAIQQALATSPDNPPILMEMGRRFMTPQTLDLSLGFFGKVLQLPGKVQSADLSQAHFLLAIGLTALGHLPDAMPHLQTALAQPGSETESRCAVLTALLADNPQLGDAFPTQVASLKSYCDGPHFKK